MARDAPVTGIDAGPGTPHLVLPGRHGRAHMLTAYRDRYQQQADQAAQALATTDADLRVQTWTGFIRTDRQPVTDDTCHDPRCHHQPALED